MTCAMDSVDYNRQNFTLDRREQRQPTVLKEKHYEFHVEKDEWGYLACQRDPATGMPITSPRSLVDMCIYKLVQGVNVLASVKACTLPSNCYHLLLTEAIHQREAQAIEWTVSTWPMKSLKVYDFIPLEDYLEDEYLTLPMEGNEKMCLVDCFVLGLLKLKPESNLQWVDFTGFDKDRRLSKELSRLPILWMKPENRTVERIHETMSNVLNVSKDKAERYLNRIYNVYSNVDCEFKHGNKIDIIQIAMDLKVAVDDVPLGLSLQDATPFRFKCHRLWMKPIHEVGFPPCNIGTVLDTSRITCFEYDDPLLPSDDVKFDQLLDGIRQLRFLVALSLPNCIDCLVNQDMTVKLNATLKALKYIQRLGLNFCNLKGQLHLLLDSCKHHLTYLSFKDTRLNEDDVMFLLHSRCIHYLRELNLSSNDFRFLDQCLITSLKRMPHMSCLSISHCQLDIHQQVLIVTECKQIPQLCVLSMQGYTPVSQNDYLELLRICARMKRLQKVLLFPKSYGFPGTNPHEREINRLGTLKVCYRYLSMKGREDIIVE